MLISLRCEILALSDSTFTFLSISLKAKNCLSKTDTLWQQRWWGS